MTMKTSQPFTYPFEPVATMVDIIPDSYYCCQEEVRIVD